MPIFAVQLFLLLLAAFFAGAMIACFVRRVFFARDNEGPSPGGGRGPKRDVEETIHATTETTTVEVKKTKTSAVEATRFGRALTGAAAATHSSLSKEVDTVPSNAPAELTAGESQITVAVEDTNGAFESSTPASDRGADPDAGVEPQQPAILSKGGVTGDARQSAVGERASAGPKEATAPVGSEPQRKEGGAGAAAPVTAAADDGSATSAVSNVSAAQTSTSAASSDASVLRSVRSEALVGDESGSLGDNVVTLPSTSRADYDDLKRIRGIGVLIEKKLNSLGVRTYAQVANWTASDVSRMSELLDFKGRIERESWIEQARILDSGGYTDFSRRAK